MFAGASLFGIYPRFIYRSKIFELDSQKSMKTLVSWKMKHNT